MTAVDVMFVVGDHSADVLRKRGARADRIFASGLPRWPEGPTGDGAPQRVSEVLYLTGAYDWHGDQLTGRQQVADVAVIAEVCNRLGINFHLRVHPRDRVERYANLGSIIDARREPLATSVVRADLVLAIASTGLLEAITLGRAAQVVCIHPQWHRFSRSFAADPMFRSIRTREQLERSLTGLQQVLPSEIYREQRVRLNHYVAADAYKASDTIVDEIASF
jgi:hypothetical protein